MTHKQTIFDATIALAGDQVLATQAVDEAWSQFEAAYQAADDALAGAGQHGMALDLEEAVNAYASELIRAAFLAGLAFDGRALLLDAAQV